MHMKNIFDNIDLTKIGELLNYSPGNPLMFNSGLFLFLFLFFLIVYRLLYRNDMGRMIFVILFSLYFYFKSSGIYVLCLLRENFVLEVHIFHSAYSTEWR